MSRFCPLYSSSDGNCIYIGNEEAAILIDVGISFKALSMALSARDINPASIKAIAVTHGHSDHTSGLKATLNKLKVPIIATADTLAYLEEHSLLPNGAEKMVADADITVDNIKISHFCTSHDCCGSCGYKISLPDERTVAVCTDLGYISDEIKETLLGCDLVMLESNHDVNMLKKNPNYPPPLKERILSDCGHLSNGQCASFLPKLVKSGTTRIILAHLSEHNNTPPIAISAARAALTEAGLREELDYILYVAPKMGGKMFIL